MAEARMRTTTKRGGARARAGGNSVAAWQDDPMGLPVQARPVPTLGTPPLAFKIKDAPIAPGTYLKGTPGFRYWTAAEALRRGGDFWAPLLGVSRWEPGAVLPVGLDEGDDLNAFYDRKHLAFFHHHVDDDTTVYSGESPDVVCHEMGHACLDAHRPELWDAPFIEAGSFHESFGDMSAMLSALQLQSVRAVALSAVKPTSESALRAWPSSWAWAPAGGAVGGRIELPAQRVQQVRLRRSGDAARRGARVQAVRRGALLLARFTGAFYEILSGMLKVQSSAPKEAHAGDGGAGHGAPADRRHRGGAGTAELLRADCLAHDRRRHHALWRQVPHAADQRLRQAQDPVGRGGRAVALHAGQGRQAQPKARGAAGVRSKNGNGVTRAAPMKPHAVRLAARDFGLDGGTLVVQAPMERVPFVAVAASVATTARTGRARWSGTRRFVSMLFAPIWSRPGHVARDRRGQRRRQP